MYPTRASQGRRRPSEIDPACAICSAPATVRCKCEANALETAVVQAEHEAMAATYNIIRQWVRDRARDYILAYFRRLLEPRKNAHTANLDRITAEAYYHNSIPTPHQIAHAEAIYEQGVNEDWKNSVLKYPEVLRYYFSLVQPSLPSDDDPSVTDPLASDFGPPHRKPNKRTVTFQVPMPISPVSPMSPNSHGPPMFPHLQEAPQLPRHLPSHGRRPRVPPALRFSTPQPTSPMYPPPGY